MSSTERAGVRTAERQASRRSARTDGRTAALSRSCAGSRRVSSSGPGCHSGASEEHGFDRRRPGSNRLGPDRRPAPHRARSGPGSDFSCRGRLGGSKGRAADSRPIRRHRSGAEHCPARLRKLPRRRAERRQPKSEGSAISAIARTLRRGGPGRSLGRRVDGGPWTDARVVLRAERHRGDPGLPQKPGSPGERQVKACAARPIKS